MCWAPGTPTAACAAWRAASSGAPAPGAGAWGRFLARGGACWTPGCLALLRASLHSLWRSPSLSSTHLLCSSRDHPDVQMRFMYSEPLAHQIYAAADCLLVPSMFEPCGLTQVQAAAAWMLPCFDGNRQRNPQESGRAGRRQAPPTRPPTHPCCRRCPSCSPPNARGTADDCAAVRHRARGALHGRAGGHSEGRGQLPGGCLADGEGLVGRRLCKDGWPARCRTSIAARRVLWKPTWPHPWARAREAGPRCEGGGQGPVARAPVCPRSSQGHPRPNHSRCCLPHPPPPPAGHRHAAQWLCV